MHIDNWEETLSRDISCVTNHDQTFYYTTSRTNLARPDLSIDTWLTPKSEGFIRNPCERFLSSVVLKQNFMNKHWNEQILS